MNQLKNIQIVASIFFYIFGFVLFGLAFLVHNNLYGELPLLVIKSMDLPFALVALLYGLSSLRISLGDDVKSDMVDAVLIFIAVFVFILLIYLNFAFKDFI